MPRVCLSHVVVLLLLPLAAWAQGEAPPTPPPSPPPVSEAPPPPPPNFQPVEPEEPDDDNVQHRLSITLSPIHLALPMGEVTGEFRITDKFSAAVILGGGVSQTIPIFELGGQVRYYLVGSFIHGLQVGAEVLGIFASAPVGTVSTVTAGGVSVGPFVGYKIAANIGFTFDFQVGPNFTVVGATSGTQSASASAVGVLLNINVGWSF